MGESERYIGYRKRKISIGADGNALMILISINAIFFIAVWFLQVIYYIIEAAPGSFENNVLPWFIMPAKLSAIAQKPWTVFTNMFIHIRVLTIITSMLWLWAFGSILQGITGNRKLIPLYIYGGIAGAVAFIAANYLLPQLKPNINFSFLYGSNAATMAIAVATTAIAPDYRFFKMLNGGIPIWVLTLLYVIIDFAGVSGASAAYNISHLAGAFIGFMFVFSLRRGSDWSLWMNDVYEWFINLFNPDKKGVQVQRRIKEKVFYKTGKQKPFIKRSNITQQRVDEILDKINQKGYHLLTEEEKNILKRAGEADF
ncbi:MAG: rhomboid family intrarane serine protease [Chitinophagaceae bacterium]|nr:rhomboid family intrarane serine protease [Chitinophagaceae bacterium]MDB5221798.1 rhomboid family intrarane serine protease [Chitinophagaceae bacterium]